MAKQSRGLFVFEDGSPLYFAVHERVTNRDIVINLIKGQNGHVVDNVIDADFCLLSSCRRETMEIAPLVTAEGGVAIESAWIWESVKLERLLPWYQYQLGGQEYGDGDDRADLEDDARDLHELSVCLARHLPIVGSVEDIYKHLSMKFPHRTSHRFKELHEENKEAVDSCVIHIAKQIDALYPPLDFFTRQNPSFLSTDSYSNSRTRSHSQPQSQSHSPIEEPARGRGHYDGIPLTPASGSDIQLRRLSQDSQSRSRNASNASNPVRSLDELGGSHHGTLEATSDQGKGTLQARGIHGDHLDHQPKEGHPPDQPRYSSPNTSTINTAHSVDPGKRINYTDILNNTASTRREYFDSLKNLYNHNGPHNPQHPYPSANVNSSTDLSSHPYQESTIHTRKFTSDGNSIIVTRLPSNNEEQAVTSNTPEPPYPSRPLNPLRMLMDSGMKMPPFDPSSSSNAYSPRSPVLSGMLKRKHRDGNQPHLGKTPSESRIASAANSVAAGPYHDGNRAARASLGTQSSYGPHSSRGPVVPNTLQLSGAHQSQPNKVAASVLPSLIDVDAYKIPSASIDRRNTSLEKHSQDDEGDEDDYEDEDKDDAASNESDDRSLCGGLSVNRNANSNGNAGAGKSTNITTSANLSARFGQPGKGIKGQKRDSTKPASGQDKTRPPKKRVTQDQIDVIVQWILDHPFEEAPSQKFYWEEFAGNCPIGSLRTAPSWCNIYQRHIKPHHAAAAVTRQQQTGATFLNNPGSTTAINNTGSIHSGDSGKAEMGDNTTQSKKSAFDFGAVGAAETPAITPAGVSEGELTIMVDYLFNNPMQGVNLQEYWKKFAEAMAPFVQRTPHDWAVIYARRRRKVDERVQLLKESVSNLPELSNLPPSKDLAPMLDNPDPSNQTPSLNHPNYNYLALLNKPPPGQSPLVPAPIPALSIASTQTSRTQSLSKDSDDELEPGQIVEEDEDIRMASPVQEGMNAGSEVASNVDEISGLTMEPLVDTNVTKRHASSEIPSSPEPETTATTYGEIQPFNLANEGPYSDEILDMAQSLYVEQCSTIPGADLTSQDTWTTFIKIHPMVEQPQIFWVYRYLRRKKQIRDLVHGADAPRSPISATRKLSGNKDKQKRLDAQITAGPSPTQITQTFWGLEHNQNQFKPTVPWLGSNNTYDGLFGYHDRSKWDLRQDEPTRPSSASNNSQSSTIVMPVTSTNQSNLNQPSASSRPTNKLSLVTSIKSSSIQLPKMSTPLSATSAKSARSMSMSISAHPSSKPSSPVNSLTVPLASRTPIEIRNVKHPWAWSSRVSPHMSFAHPSDSSQSYGQTRSQTLSPSVHPYSILTSLNSKGQSGTDSSPSRLGHPITLEDKQAMARFVHMRPRGETEAMSKWWETFIEYYKEGGYKRNALAWGSRFQHHEIEIRAMIAQIAEKERCEEKERLSVARLEAILLRLESETIGSRLPFIPN